jgi:hypothetical protein
MARCAIHIEERQKPEDKLSSTIAMCNLKLKSVHNS